MTKKTKVWLIAAVLLILIGCVVFVGVMTMLKWDFRKLSTVSYETKTHEITETFSNIAVNIDTADIFFVPSETEKNTVTCYELTTDTHSVAVKDGTLRIEVSNSGKWYKHIGINFDTPKITVAIPKGQYISLDLKVSTGDVQLPGEFLFESISVTGSTGDVTCYASAEEIKIKIGTGNIRIEKIAAEKMDLTVSTGKVTVADTSCTDDLSIRVSTGKVILSDIQCRNLTSVGNTGKIDLMNVTATDKIEIERSTGDVNFDRCDAGELYVKTDTGDVSGSLLSEKVFITATDTGQINVPNTVTGGKCQITTDTGDIIITVE